MEIEVFRAGTPAANAAGITAADLADVAAFDCAANPVPNVIGHPKTDSPAHGAIRGFRADGNVLFADVPDDQAVFKPVLDGIRAKSILNRSMAFWGKWHKSNPTPGKIAPKHLGFLGGAAPGIAGMKPLAESFAFAADDSLEITGDPAEAVVFDAAPTPVLTVTDDNQAGAAPAATQEPSVATEKEIKDREDAIAAREKAAEDREKEFAAKAEEARNAANLSTVERLVADSKVLPADKDDLVAAFNAVDGGELIAFASDDKKAKASPVSIIAGIMAKAGNVVPTGEDPVSPQFTADGEGKPGELEKVRADRNARYNK